MRRFGRSFLASRGAWTVLSMIVFVSVPGCFITIADPAVDSTGGRPTVGTGGGSAGVCGGCSLANVAKYGCSDGGCTIVECEADFVDCDGKPENGCETDFHVDALDASTATSVPNISSIALDGDANEWSGPRYAMNLPCEACDHNQPGGQNGEPILYRSANAEDLTAAFRVAWDDALYVFVQVRDDQIVARELNNLERQDGIELFINGDLNDVNPQYSPDVHHLFVGALAKDVVERNQQLQNGDIEAFILPRKHCYFVEMRLSWYYIMGRMSYAPTPGDRHGFSIAVNDWDVAHGAEAGAPAERETQLFWGVPGKNYSYETTGFGVVTLE